MSDPVTHSDIEDVLSSIRRLVSEDTRPKQGKATQPEKLLLTPALRIETPEDAAESEEPDQALAPNTADEIVDSFDFSVNSRSLLIETAKDMAQASEPEREPVQDPEASPDETLAAEPEAPAEVDQGAGEDEDHVALSEPEPEDLSEDEIDAAPDAEADDTGADEHPVADAPEPADVVSEPAETMADEESPLAPVDDALERKIAALERLVSEGEPQDWEEQEETAPVGLFQHNPPRALSYERDATEPPEMVEPDHAPEPETAEAAEPPAEEPRAEEPAAEVPRAADPSEDSLRQAFVRTPVEDQRAPQTDRRATAEVTPLHPSTPPAAADDDEGMIDLMADDESFAIDEEMLRDLVAEMVRQELQGALGERITRNVRKLVRREIHRMMTSKEFD